MLMKTPSFLSSSSHLTLAVRPLRPNPSSSSSLRHNPFRARIPPVISRLASLFSFAKTARESVNNFPAQSPKEYQYV